MCKDNRGRQNCNSEHSVDQVCKASTATIQQSSERKVQMRREEKEPNKEHVKQQMIQGHNERLSVYISKKFSGLPATLMQIAYFTISSGGMNTLEPLSWKKQHSPSWNA